MQVILDSSFARPGSAPNGAGRKESSGTGIRFAMCVLRFSSALESSAYLKLS